MSDADPSQRGPRRQLSLLDGICLIVGIIVGSGIYETSPLIARSAGGPGGMLAVWGLGGLIALAGALCYAELTSAYPMDGGDYVFLSRAYGRRMGLFFAWCEFWIIRPGNIGALAFVFSRYANNIFPLSSGIVSWVAYPLLAILILTMLNIAGVRSGKRTQNLLTGVKIVGLLIIAVVGMSMSSGAIVAAAEPVTRLPHETFSLAMILVMFCYGGWAEISFVAAEVRHPARNLLRTLVLGTLGVTVVYLLVNLAFLASLGWSGVAQSEAVATDLLSQHFGSTGERAVSLLICISCLGAINGTIFAGARVYYAAGREHPACALLGRWSRQFDSPAWALVFQAAISTALVVTIGAGKDGFERLVMFTAPVYWSFALLTTLSLFILRRRQPNMQRPFRVIGYPVTPLLFCSACAAMIWAGVRYAYTNRLDGSYWHPAWSIGLMVLGVVAVWLSQASEKTVRE